MKTLTALPSHDYKSAKAAIAAYNEGADFILADITSPWHGKPCSARDFPSERVCLRYYNKTRIVLTSAN